MDSLTEFLHVGFMQRACQKIFANWAGWCLTGWLLTGVAFAAEPAEGMLSGAKKWVASQHNTSAQSVVLSELDARLRVPVCKDTGGWHYDFPFSSQDTVRARCGTPVVQFYMRIAKGSGGSGAPEKSGSGVNLEMRQAVVLKRGLLRGTRLTADDLQLVQLPVAQLPLQSIDNLDNAVDAELTRDVLSGKPLRGSDLRAALMVKRGQTVTLTLRQPSGFAVSAQVEALQDGRKGDSIRLKNRESGRILTGKVTGLNSLQAQ
ncbi:MAG: Flagella basal body P-ring formation protein FlgA precursor [Pseudomonadota bacterium]|jgi:flagella basal body P-ring formation protein FlgA